jgi:hypothetical protein
MLIDVGGIQESLTFPVTQDPHRRILVEGYTRCTDVVRDEGNVDRIGAPGAYLDKIGAPGAYLDVRCKMVRIGRMNICPLDEGVL